MKHLLSSTYRSRLCFVEGYMSYPLALRRDVRDYLKIEDAKESLDCTKDGA